MSIAGSPGGVEAAAGTIEGAGRDFTDAAESIASHGRAVTADWTGSAADAAGAAIAALATRTRVGAGVCAGVGPVLRTYAGELRAAQGQYDDGSATAQAGASAQRSATAAGRSAGAMAQDDPGRADAQAAAVRAGDRADAQVRAGQALMTAAVGRAERANAAAAAAIDALTGQLDDMTATTTPVQSTSGDWGGGAAGDWGDGSPSGGSGAEAHHHGWFFNAVGGLGNAAWSAGPGLVGDIARWSPFADDKAVGRRIEGAHDWLSDWYGADTDSRAYRGSDGVGQVATFFIPGEGWVKGAKAATKADDLLRVGDEALTRGDDAARALGEGPAAGRGVEAPAAGAGERIPWTSWKEYPKVERDGREYARVGDRLYSRHAVDRMQPSGLGAPAGAVDAGRSISPNYIDDVLRNTEGVPVTGPGGVARLSHTSGSVQVITEGDVIITVITR